MKPPITIWLLTLGTGAALWLMLSGCGKTVQLNGFEAYVESFEDASRLSGKSVHVDNLIIEYAQTAGQLAICETGFARTPKIAVNRAAWEKANDTKREIIMFHEMGHCVLKRDHLDDTFPDGRPQSVMHTHGVREGVYRKDRVRYHQELFL